MPIEKWNESGREWEEDHGLLDDKQVAKCARADVAEPFRPPIPTRMVSNGEYMPVPQTDKQKQVEARIEELSVEASKKLGMDRRHFLRSSGGMAAAMLAMNEVFGRFFNISAIELFEPAAYAAASAPQDLFVFDDQLHFVRGSQPSFLRTRSTTSSRARCAAECRTLRGRQSTHSSCRSCPTATRKSARPGLRQS